MGDFGDLIYKNLVGGYTATGSTDKVEVGRKRNLVFWFGTTAPTPSWTGSRN